MILCPFIFVLASPVKLSLQSAEVASAHWVPLRYLLSPQRTREAVDVSNRMSRNPLVKQSLRYMLGPMTFPAIRLIPSESCGQSPEDLQLWGLTLGIIADFLDMFQAVELEYPTFATPDLRFILWIITYSLRWSSRIRRPNVDSTTAAHLEIGRHARHIDTLNGYFTRVHYAVAVWLGFRTTGLLVLVYLCLKLAVLL